MDLLAAGLRMMAAETHPVADVEVAAAEAASRAA